MTSNQHFVPVQGTLTADPELKYLPSGVAAAELSLAFNPRTFDKNSGEWKDGEPTFFNCQAYGYLAEGIAAHPDLRRGKRAIGYGRISTRSWEDKNGGGKRSRDEYVLDAFGPDVSFYAKDQEQGGQAGGGQYGGQQGGGQYAGGGNAGGGQWAQNQGGGPATGGQSDPWAGTTSQTGGGQWGHNPNQGGGQWG